MKTHNINFYGLYVSNIICLLASPVFPYSTLKVLFDLGKFSVKLKKVVYFLLLSKNGTEEEIGQTSQRK